MQFEVPQFIDIEDRIFGPLTWRQFLYLGGGIGMGVVLFFTTSIIIFLLIGLPLAVLAGALAFYPVNNRPFSFFLEAIFNYLGSSKLYLWRKKDEIVHRNMFTPNSVNKQPPELIQNEIVAQTASLKEAEKALLAATKAHTESKKVLADERVIAEAQIKYGSVIKFRDDQKADAELFSNPAVKRGVGVAAGLATAGALTAAGMAGGAVLIPAGAIALLTHELIRSVGEMNQKGAQAITSVYGANGVAKDKKNKKKQELSLLAEAQKDAGLTEEAKPGPTA